VKPSLLANSVLRVCAALALGCTSSGGSGGNAGPDGSAVDDAMGSSADSGADVAVGIADASSDGSGAVDGGMDGASVVDALVDRAPVYTVQCGPVTCGLVDAGYVQTCCTNDLGVTGTCVYANSACANPFFHCDGRPGYCIPTASCCFFGGGTSCLPNGSCVSAANGLVVCQTVGDCNAGESCCPLAPSSSFRVCRTGACP
jgi:hypothetical protein